MHPKPSPPHPITPTSTSSHARTASSPNRTIIYDTPTRTLRARFLIKATSTYRQMRHILYPPKPTVKDLSGRYSVGEYTASNSAMEEFESRTRKESETGFGYELAAFSTQEGADANRGDNTPLGTGAGFGSLGSGIADADDGEDVGCCPYQSGKTSRLLIHEDNEHIGQPRHEVVNENARRRRAYQALLWGFGDVDDDEDGVVEVARSGQGGLRSGQRWGWLWRGR